GRVDRRGDGEQVVEEGRRRGAARRAAVRDFDRQGGRRDPGARGRGARRDQGARRADGAGADAGGGDRDGRGRRSPRGGSLARSGAARAVPAVPAPAAAAAAARAKGGDGAETVEERLRRRSTPLVRKIAAEHQVDLSTIPGTGFAGRVTKQDILSFLERGAA